VTTDLTTLYGRFLKAVNELFGNVAGFEKREQALPRTSVLESFSAAVVESVGVVRFQHHRIDVLL
jgi:hypothetical protein